MNQTAKFLLDIAPLAAFMLGFKLFDMQVATIALMVATALSLGIIYIFEKKLAIAPLVTGVMVGVFGTLTLILHDETFIKIKPTIINLLLASLLLGGVAFKKPMLQYVMGVAFQLNDTAWRILTIRLGLFFILLAIVNEVVWRHFSTDFWISFKLFGMLGLNILFWLANTPFIARHQVKQDGLEKE